MGSHAGTRKDGGRSLAALRLQRVLPYEDEIRSLETPGAGRGDPAGTASPQK